MTAPLIRALTENHIRTPTTMTSLTIELAVGILAVLVAAWQLYLQRKEIAKGNRLNHIKATADIIREEINYRERMIQYINMDSDLCEESKEDHLNRINKLRPTLKKLESEILNLYKIEMIELKTIKDDSD